MIYPSVCHCIENGARHFRVYTRRHTKHVSANYPSHKIACRAKPSEVTAGEFYAPHHFSIRAHELLAKPEKLRPRVLKRSLLCLADGSCRVENALQESQLSLMMMTMMMMAMVEVKKNKTLPCEARHSCVRAPPLNVDGQQREEVTQVRDDATYISITSCSEMNIDSHCPQLDVR